MSPRDQHLFRAGVLFAVLVISPALRHWLARLPRTPARGAAMGLQIMGLLGVIAWWVTTR